MKFWTLPFLLSACTLGLDTKYMTSSIDTGEASIDDPEGEPGAEPSDNPGNEPSNQPSSEPSTEENPNLGECDDGIDNDQDGLTDCYDDDCITTPSCVDMDGDGYSQSEDCDDANNSVYPGAVEIANDGIDQDCNGQDYIYEDSNGNNGNNNPPTAEDCANGIDDDYNGLTDCDDYNCILDAACTENCTNGIDDNGNGMIDCDDYYCALDSNCNGSTNTGVDADYDGYDSLASGGNDCDDSDYNTHPGSAFNELNYNDCMTDVDGDGYGDDNPASGVIPGSDCNDNSYYINPGAYDYSVDGTDQNCDGVDGSSYGTDSDGDGYDSIASGGTDCDDSDFYTYPGAAYYDSWSDCMTDVDGDNYGDDNPASGVTPGTDCDDNSYSINPSAYEYANDGIDQDCDGIDGSSAPTGTDYDGDGYDSISSGGTDCDDYDTDTYPGAAFLDSTTDCMEDADGDGYGDDYPPYGVTAGTDCNDSQSYTYPGAAYNDSTADCMQDEDFDGYGDDWAVYATHGTDCDDTDADTYPGAAFLDSTTDCMTDVDGDGYGDDGYSYYADSGTDCDDADYTINPSAYDVPSDGIDQDCDGSDASGGGSSSNCSSSEIEDCNGNCAQASWLGDGYCDQGTMSDLYGNYPDFDCAALSYDSGDCSTSSTPSGQCCYTIDMYDSYGDGWNGAYVHGYENGSWSSQHTISYGTSGSDSICIGYGSDFLLAFSSGSYDEEISFSLYHPDGYLVYSDLEPIAGTVYTESAVTCQ